MKITAPTLALIALFSPAAMPAAAFPHPFGTFDGCPICSAQRAGGGALSDSDPSDPTAIPESSLARLKRLAAEAQAEKLAAAKRAENVAATSPAAPLPAPSSAMTPPTSKPAVAAAAAPAPLTAVTTPWPSTPGEPAFPEIKRGTDGYWRVSFQNLASFAYATPPSDQKPTPGKKQDIPANVLALEGKKVCVGGYMLPIQMEGGLVKQFLLIRNPMMCCYGVVPAANEWVLVKMKGKGVVPMMDVPLNFYGTLHVGEVYEDSMFAGIYQLEGDKVAVN